MLCAFAAAVAEDHDGRLLLLGRPNDIRPPLERPLVREDCIPWRRAGPVHVDDDALIPAASPAVRASVDTGIAPPVVTCQGRAFTDRAASAHTAAARRRTGSEGISIRPHGPPIPGQFIGPPLRDALLDTGGESGGRPASGSPCGARRSVPGAVATWNRHLWVGAPGPTIRISVWSGLVALPLVHQGCRLDHETGHPAQGTGDPTYRSRSDQSCSKPRVCRTRCTPSRRTRPPSGHG